MTLRLIKGFQKSAEDERIDVQIKSLMARINRAKSNPLKRQLFREVQRLRAERSPEYVRHLEQQKGLR